MSGQSTPRSYARPESPCPVCGRTKSCSTGSDGLILCRGSNGPMDGFRHLGAARGDQAFHLYRRADDPITTGPETAAARPDGAPRAEGESARKSSRRNWLLLAQQQASLLTASLRQQLAGWLCLPPWSLDAIQYLGWKPRDRSGACWTIPMQDGHGEIVGQQRRWRDDTKFDESGSTQGLFVASAWEEREGPVYVAEGASDTLALAALGLAAIGRHHCSARTDQLAQMLSTCPGREIVVIGDHDYDYQQDTHPGRDGARAAAQSLAAALCRPVSWSLPPAGHKDVRAWCQTLSTLPADEQTWRTAGQRFVERLSLHTCSPAGGEQAGQGLALRSLDQIEVAVMRWLVPGYLPAGELVLLSGDGGEGKSLVTLHLAAQITRGEPCFGLAYDAGPPRSVILAACEDDAATTTKPRLWATGADMARVHLVDGVRLPDGSVAPFGLQHVEQIRHQLQLLPDVALIIIDPVTAYLGSSGMDDSSDTEIRTLLEPLRLACRQTGAVCCMVKHFNKGASPRARSRIAGSSGWVNASRASYLVLPEPGETRRKCWLADKINGAAAPDNLLYRVTLPGPSETAVILADLPADWPAEDRQAFANQLARVEWLGVTDWDADSICGEEVVQTREEGPDAQRAANWLRKFLGAGPQPSQQCADAGNAALQMGRTAKWWRDRVLRGECAGKSMHARGFDGGWLFCLPGQEPPDPAQEALEG